MGLAKDEIERANRGEGCLGKAAPDEPVFILRAQDALAPVLVALWAGLADIVGNCPPEKVEEAVELAKSMVRWPNRKLPD